MTKFYSNVSRCLERRYRLLGFEKLQTFCRLWKNNIHYKKI
jgi:hypothetical protein